MSDKQKSIESIIGGDMGNTNLKLVWGDRPEDRLLIPNVIGTAAETRPYFEPEKDPLSGLHVSIKSPALKNAKTINYVGLLARQAEDKEEILTATKSESDQHMIVFLTGLAYVATKLSGKPTKEINATYYLGVSLPVVECKDAANKETLKKRLLGTHSVEFLQTPGLEGVKVNVHIAGAEVGLEGVPALIALTSRADSKAKMEDIYNSAVMMADIGGGSMDLPIITPEGVDNQSTDGTDIGANHYLDKIIEDVAYKKGAKLKSRDHLTKLILEGSYEVICKGISHNIKEIVDEHLGNLAKKAYKAIDSQWEKKPEVRLCYVVSGGAALIPQYLKAINQAPGVTPLPLRYVEPIEESIWLNASGNHMVALRKYKAKLKGDANG